MIHTHTIESIQINQAIVIFMRLQNTQSDQRIMRYLTLQCSVVQTPFVLLIEYSLRVQHRMMLEQTSILK